METNSKKIVALIASIVVLISLFIIAARLFPSVDHRKDGNLGVTLTSTDSNYMDAIGTASAPATATTLYTSSTSAVLRTLGLSQVAIGGKYKPTSYGSNYYLQIERSIDNGQTYVPYQTLTAQSNSVLVNASPTSSTSTVGSTPFIVPGNLLYGSTSGTTIPFSFDLSMVADYIRVSGKEVSTSTLGTIFVQVKTINQ